MVSSAAKEVLVTVENVYALKDGKVIPASVPLETDSASLQEVRKYAPVTVTAIAANAGRFFL